MIFEFVNYESGLAANRIKSFAPEASTIFRVSSYSLISEINIVLIVFSMYII